MRTPHPSTAGRLRRALAVLVLALTTLFTSVALAAPAQAATYRVGTHVCTDYFPIYSSAKWGYGVNLDFGSHASANVRLNGKYSWRWARDSRGNALPWSVKNHYHVRFLDRYGRELWKEYNSLPNGGARTYYVGSNVRVIQVIADQSYCTWAVRPAVALG